MSNSAPEDETTILPKSKRLKHENEAEDKLSDLPDCVILHILSFLNAKEVVRTCILSTRLKNLWKRVPTLVLHSTDFSTFKSFTKFVSKILSLRDGSIALQTLDFERVGSIEPHLLKRIVNYAFARNVQRFGMSVKGDICHILPCISSCRTLTSLKLSVSPKGRHNYGRTLFPKSLDLPALTSLHLGNFAFCASEKGRTEPFSGFKKLNSLVIDNCTVKDAQILCILSETLVNLTMRNHSSDVYKIELAAPSLCMFAFSGTPYQKLCGSNLSSVKEVNIDAEMLSNYTEPPLVLLSWLLELANIKSLTVSASTLQVLSLIPDLLKDKLTSLCNLKSLKVQMKPLSYGLSMTLRTAKLQKESKAGSEPSSSIPDGIVDFLIQNSPSAEVDIIDCSRFGSSIDHLPPFPGSSIFPQFLQPSSRESVVDDLRQRIQQLEQAVLQVQLYIQLAHEEISRERDEMSAIQGHMTMLSKTLAALKRQMQTMGLWQ
ncbi:F-box/LRR-repeat protein At4g14103-like isoform X1 [Vicia villosa]|uniref:F-box/LRR-repeat protein At4g14103-like isoform X1 n=1 Tax=Vicia villosa TaxID=3911 RepID=UPI00273C8833|nr:F-box/LRR-repeat protein At4g14103-like isoform X1 [Vicia villosa]